MLITAKDKIALVKFKKQMTQKYEMTDLGEAQQFLGLQIQRNREAKTLFIYQSQYIENILTRLDMQDCNGASTPMEASSKLLAADPNESPQNHRRYQSIVGSLMYAMLSTRPDLAYAVSTLCRFLSNPTNAHHGAAKQVIRYLRPTQNYGLCYEGILLKASAYSDSDWANDKDTRRSISRFVFNLNGAAVSWKSRRQSAVALSSMEAEYIAYAEAAKEAIWL